MGADGAGLEAWSASVGHHHRGWQVRPSGPAAGDGDVRCHELEGFSVVSSRAPACHGVRDADREAEHHDGDEVGVLVLHAGREEVAAGRETRQLTAGQALVWDTSRDGSFRIDRFVDKSTIFLPRSLVEEWTSGPTHAGATAPGWGVVPAERTLMLRSMIRALDQLPARTLAELDGVALASALRELTYVALVEPTAAPGTPTRRRSATWARAVAVVEGRLGSPVSAELLAVELSMSVRAVYQLFADHHTTVRRFVKERRLLRARADLARVGDQETVAAVARRWGFADRASFSKAFRARFDVSPGAFARSGAGHRVPPGPRARVGSRSTSAGGSTGAGGSTSSG